jgi:hypothetical protein
VDALAALGREQGDDVVARGERRDAATDRLDDPGALVPEHARCIAARIRSGRRVEIGVADAAGDDPDERLARLRLRELDVLDDERLPELLEDCGPDVQRCEVAPAGSSS